LVIETSSAKGNASIFFALIRLWSDAVRES
jgi:hypothetical protein